jgi:hypothetical protein
VDHEVQELRNLGLKTEFFLMGLDGHARRSVTVMDSDASKLGAKW